MRPVQAGDGSGSGVIGALHQRIAGLEAELRRARCLQTMASRLMRGAGSRRSSVASDAGGGAAGAACLLTPVAGQLPGIAEAPGSAAVMEVRLLLLVLVLVLLARILLLGALLAGAKRRGALPAVLSCKLPLSRSAPPSMKARLSRNAPPSVAALQEEEEEEDDTQEAEFMAKMAQHLVEQQQMQVAAG
jgi:hypothetical protein